MSQMQLAVAALNNIVTAMRGQGSVLLEPFSAVLASTGGPMAVFADSTNNPSVPGPQITNSKTFPVRWNNAATFTGIGRNAMLPTSLDTTQNMIFNAIVSKTGATVGDATTIDIAAYLTYPGVAHDSASSIGGTTNAVVGNLTAKTESLLQFTITAANIAAALPAGGPANLAVTIAPTAGTLGTDDFLLHMAWITFGRKFASS